MSAKSIMIIGDIDLYTIKVHALKSTARIMGARELSLLAEELEKAGNENDLDKITAETGRLLEMYRGFKEKLSRIDAAHPGLGCDGSSDAITNI